MLGRLQYPYCMVPVKISNCIGIVYKMNTTGTVRRGKLNEVWVLNNVHILSCSAIKDRVKKGGRWGVKGMWMSIEGVFKMMGLFSQEAITYDKPC